MGSALHFLTLYNEEGEALFDRIGQETSAGSTRTHLKTNSSRKNGCQKVLGHQRNSNGNARQTRCLRQSFGTLKGSFSLTSSTTKFHRNPDMRWTSPGCYAGPFRISATVNCPNECSTYTIMRVRGPHKSRVSSLLQCSQMTFSKIRTNAVGKIRTD